RLRKKGRPENRPRAGRGGRRQCSSVGSHHQGHRSRDLDGRGKSQRSYPDFTRPRPGGENNALNFPGRQSRLSLLAESKSGSATTSGYYEADFLGAGTTSNNRQSNSYVFRQRQAFASALFTNGFY